jgi:hypothetical protein
MSYDEALLPDGRPREASAAAHAAATHEPTTSC